MVELLEDIYRALAAWFNKWIGQGKHVHNYNGFLNGARCYGFRCDMLHLGESGKPHRRGASGKPHRNYDRIVFVLPGAINSTMHLCISRRILLMDLEMSCYSQGIAPDIVGIPLIG